MAIRNESPEGRAQTSARPGRAGESIPEDHRAPEARHQLRLAPCLGAFLSSLFSPAENRAGIRGSYLRNAKKEASFFAQTDSIQVEDSVSKQKVNL
jgi:hypothetical protein